MGDEWQCQGTRLSDKQVEEILDWCRKGVKPIELGIHYRVHSNTIRNIRKGTTHKKVFDRWCKMTALKELGFS